MLRFQHVEMSVLMDMLALHTARYTKMMMEGGGHNEFESCGETIEILQKEIRFRNNECDVALSQPVSHSIPHTKGSK